MSNYRVVTRGKDAADYYSNLERIRELEGKEGTALWRKMLPLIKEVDHKDGWYRPDLSYTPQR
jgi:hypothetical protein